jgi:hypothetical protein
MQLRCEHIPIGDPTRRAVRPRHLRLVRSPWGEQLYLFPPSVMRRQSVRRRSVYRYIDIRGTVITRATLETVPCVVPTSADDAGLPNWRRWTPPRHAKSFDALPYAEDMTVRMFVRDHPEGAAMSEVAEAIGWSKQGVMEVERRAIKKLIVLATKYEWAAEWMADNLGIDMDDLERLIQRRGQC